MARTRLFTVISNPWTYRNIFSTAAIDALRAEFDLIFACDQDTTANRIRARFPDMEVITIPYTLAPQTRSLANQQFYHEAGLYPGTSRELMLRYRRANSRSRRDRIMTWLGLPVRVNTSTQQLRNTMDAVINALKLDPLYPHLVSQMRDSKPDVVWLGTTFIDLDLLAIVAAHELDLPVITTVLGWDNISSKQLPLYPSLAYLIWGDTMEDDLKFYFEFVGQTIPLYKTGSAQFDIHAHYKQHPIDRAAVAASYGLDPTRKILMYAGTSPTTMYNEPDLVVELVEATRSMDAQLFIRLHPKDRLTRWEKVRAIRGVVLFEPRREDTFEAWMPNEHAVKEMVEQILMSDVVINNASTITLDTCILDKPVVNSRYEPTTVKVRRSDFLFEYDHMRQAVQTGAFPVCNSLREIVQEIETALKNPAQRRSQRAEFVRSVLGEVDGKTTERIVNALREITANVLTPDRR